ncbi:MAG: NapC/NirT family cytochrome c [Rhodospirillaceae bacterium]|nr:NapC/NirT family cytochrome c [Rhodospirillaceae bacterium]
MAEQGPHDSPEQDKASSSGRSRRRLTVLFGIGLAGFLAGVLALSGGAALLEKSNDEAFCTSCHEMRNTAAAEFAGTAHDRNRSGMRATCSDCHVPRELGPKLVRKMRAANEVVQHLRGTIDTPEKYEARRLDMARRVWIDLKTTDSRECRACHDERAMDPDAQSPGVAELHETARQKGQTCIDCHQGVAHDLPAGMSAVWDEIERIGRPENNPAQEDSQSKP